MKIHRHIFLLVLTLLLPLGTTAQSSDARLVDAVALYDKGDMAGAERLLTRLTEADPSDDALWYYLGKAEAAQGIMDEECNRPTYNNQQAETRRHVALEALDPEGDHLAGSQDVEADFREEDFAELYRAIEKLRPQQRDLIQKVFWEDMKQIEIARAEGVNESAISWRMARIYARLKKYLDKEK